MSEINNTNQAAKLVVPQSLINHLSHKFKTTIESCNVHTINLEVSVNNLLNKLINDNTIATTIKNVNEVGLLLAKAIRVQPETILSFINGDGSDIDVSGILTKYQEYLDANRAIFHDIKARHDNLLDTEWQTAAGNTNELVKYSTAAELMGDKVWVQQGNDWMKNFAVQFFHQGGARKHHMKMRRDEYQARNGAEMPLDANNAMFDTLVKDLLEPTATHADNVSKGKIRLLDVGSCYNPIAAEDSGALFAVTALDLYPAHSSVLQCDFLNLQVGPEGSESVITLPNSTEKLPSLCGTSQSATTLDESGMSKLVQLPAGSFDAVAMSLVLNYLPSPAHREAMVAKARQLLVGPGHNGRPHHSGLLLIVEKQSIFGKDLIAHKNVWGAGQGSLLRNWKECIRDHGFELVRYRPLESTDGHRSHLFAFAATDNIVHRDCALSTVVTPSSQNLDLRARLWIKQDFDHLLDTSCSPPTTEPGSADSDQQQFVVRESGEEAMDSVSAGNKRGRSEFEKTDSA